MSESVTATYKVGKNKGRPRIWIDGRRLADAGFTGGTEYTSYVFRGHGELFTAPARASAIVCSIEPFDNGEFPDQFTKRKVTGRPGGKPIIDLLGRDVEAAFPGAERVRATFSPGKIVIERE